MKVLVAGGRDFKPTKEDWFKLRDALLSSNCTELVSGGASGADLMGELCAAKLNIPVKPFAAEWAKHGKAAGPMRNQLMADYADAAIFFPGGRGTADMKRRWMATGKPILFEE